MTEMTQVWERLFIGGHDDAQSLLDSNPKRITTVISLFETSVVRRNPDINYLHMPIDDVKPISVGQLDATSTRFTKTSAGERCFCTAAAG